MGIEWRSDVGEADWWVERLHPFATDVGSIVPDGFDAYARVFHPVIASEQAPLRWSEIASITGRVVHPEMQFDPIATMTDGSGRVGGEHPPDGTLTRVELQTLASVLASRTSTPRQCWFAIWSGYGQLHGGATVITWSPAPGSELGAGVRGRAEPRLPASVLDGPRIHAPGREYYLAAGALDELDDFYEQVGDQSPNIWWPADRSWIVATEIDFSWTYVGGDRETIDAILATADIEALESRIDHAVTFDGDRINA